MSVRVYKVGGPALEDPGLVGPLAEEVRRGARSQPSSVHGGGRAVDRVLRGSRHRVAVHRRPARDVARGHGGGGDGALRHRSTRRWPRGSTAAGVPAVGISGRDGGLIRARLEPGLGRVGTPEDVNPGRCAASGRRGFLPVVSPVANGPLGRP